MSKQSRGVGDAVKARRGVLELSQRDLSKKAGVDVTSIQQIESGARERLQERTKAKLEDALGWVAGSIDHVLSGGEPTLRLNAEPQSPRPLSPLLEELLTASHARLAEIAEQISSDTGNQAAGDQWLQSVLQMRRPRDEVELNMLQVKDDPKVIWSYVLARRERLRDEALEQDPRMGRSG
jgi:transcriptional regulator with XRE-family HTH domain